MYAGASSRETPGKLRAQIAFCGAAAIAEHARHCGGGSLHDDINRVLQTQHGFRSALSAVEISRIVDPHFPADGSAEFRIGCDGFDWDDLHCHLFPDFQLAWTGTSGHLGVIDRTRLDAKWLAEERRLSERYPLDGSGFSAVWIRD